MDVNDDDLLAEQRSYYRARAPEYDEWWQRRGRFDRGEEQLLEWQRQVAVVDDALASFGATGSVLELAGGTGWWTERLARTADRLTVVDSSPEVLALNQERVGRSDVNYVVADLFDWQADSKYDAGVLLLLAFARAKGPIWRVLVPGSLMPHSLGPGVPHRQSKRPSSQTRRAKDPFVVQVRHRPSPASSYATDREYRVVSVMYEPGELQSLIEAEGWTTEIQATRWFIFGSAGRL